MIVETDTVRCKFSSPFIEERLYLLEWYRLESCKLGSRPLLSRSGCISEEVNEWLGADDEVLVPFYRGAVVFLDEKKSLVEMLRFSSPFIEERLYF